MLVKSVQILSSIFLITILIFKPLFIFIKRPINLQLDFSSQPRVANDMLENRAKKFEKSVPLTLSLTSAG